MGNSVEPPAIEPEPTTTISRTETETENDNAQATIDTAFSNPTVNAHGAIDAVTEAIDEDERMDTSRTTEATETA